MSKCWMSRLSLEKSEVNVSKWGLMSGVRGDTGAISLRRDFLWLHTYFPLGHRNTNTQMYSMYWGPLPLQIHISPPKQPSSPTISLNTSSLQSLHVNRREGGTGGWDRQTRSESILTSHTLPAPLCRHIVTDCLSVTHIEANRNPLTVYSL